MFSILSPLVKHILFNSLYKRHDLITKSFLVTLHSNGIFCYIWPCTDKKMLLNENFYKTEVKISSLWGRGRDNLRLSGALQITYLNLNEIVHVDVNLFTTLPQYSLSCHLPQLTLIVNAL